MPTVTTGRVGRMIELGRAAEASRVGYDQWARWTWLDKANRRILANKDTDCSALSAGLAWLAGYPVNINGLCWTGNLASLMQAAGWKAYRFQSLGQVQPGDMVLNVRSHVVLALSATEWLSAERDERGRAHGGRPGDQDGREVIIRAPYNRSGGWDYILRPPVDPSKPSEQTPSHAPTPKTKPAVTRPPFAKLAVDGQLGRRTWDAVQWWVDVPRDGISGPVTRRALQKAVGVTQDGIIGPRTVKSLQRIVGASQDGIWGSGTTRALQTWLNKQVGY